MIQDWMLERYRLNELSPAERAQVDAALAQDPALKAKLDALEADSQALLARLPAAQVAREVERRAARAADEKPGFHFRLPPFAIAAFATALVALLAWNNRPDILIKGPGPVAKLMLYRKSPQGQERLFDASPVAARQQIQVAFEPEGHSELVVVSIDGGGHVTLHYPLDGNSHIDPKFKNLPSSFELDDAPGYERFFLVAADRPIDVDQVMNAARALALRPDAKTAMLPLPGRGVVQNAVRLDKVNR